MRRSFVAWFTEATNLRTFALINLWVWAAQHPLLIGWYLLWPDSFRNGAGILYLSQISIAALWLSSLAWWQSTRVEVRQIEAETNQADGEAHRT